MSVSDDLQAQYERAKELAEQIEATWVAEGRPLTSLGGATGRAEVIHPLVTLLQSARRDVDRFAIAISQVDSILRLVGYGLAFSHFLIPSNVCFADSTADGRSSGCNFALKKSPNSRHIDPTLVP